MGLFWLLLWSPLMDAVNPYREAGAFLLLLAGVLSFFRGEKRASALWGLLAGLACGASAGFRETTLLSLLPLCVWTLVRLRSEIRCRVRWGWVVALAVGGLLGLSPMFYQNWRFSGNALVPAYSAHLVLDAGYGKDPQLPSAGIEQGIQVKEKAKLSLRASTLVPGMRASLFAKNFPRTLDAIRRQFGPIGLALLAVGLLVAVRRRDRIALGFLLPSALLNTLFYSCYWYVKMRYLLIVCVLLLPIAALGLTSLLGWIWNLRGNPNPAKAWGRTAWLAVLVCGVCAAYSLRRQGPELKVWEIADFREQLLPHLKAPRQFVGYYHHREILSWLVDRDFNHGPLGMEISRTVLQDEGLDAALRHLSLIVRAELLSREHYFHGRHTPPLLTLWADVERVVRLGDLPVRAYHYGRPLEDWLYRVKFWEDMERVWRIPLQAAGKPTVLMLNARRIWDLPGRSFCRLSANGQPILERVENGSQFIPLPTALTSEAKLELHCESDAPLPGVMPSRLWSMDETLDLELGMRPDWWFHTLLSTGLKNHSPLRGDACMLWQEGEMTLPHFAASNRWSFVELRMEFYQEDPSFQTLRHVLQSGDRTWPLPPTRSQSRAVFPLGQGTGSLAWIRVPLRTSLPDFPAQTELGRLGEISKYAFVKFFDARIFSLPGPNADALRIVIGDRDSGAYLVEGFYWEEKHLGTHKVRWTAPDALLRIPALPPQGGMELTLRFFDHRRDHPTPVSLVWNGSPLPHTVARDGDETVLTARPPTNTFRSDGWQELRVESPGWSPADTNEGKGDKRLLGILLHRVDLIPVEFDALQ